MNDSIFDACSKIIPHSYISLCQGARNSRSNSLELLITKRKLPEDGWSDDLIENLLMELSNMDSNNFGGNVGVGEREGRIHSSLVRRRHYRMSHGIGRSGDITAVQPKAAGSSLLNHITNCLVLDSLKMAGVTSCQACFVVPMATGMALALCMQTFRNMKPSAKYVIWPRIDQKSCFKSIATAGYKAVVVENRLEGDQLVTDLEAVEECIKELGMDSILCVMSTTSCFAPRAVDRLEEVAKLCDRYHIAHLVNNAYGVQSSKCMHVIQQASRVGRLDAFVQSSDKNYQVPVGGAIIAGFDQDLIDSISQTYPGRASATPSIDLLITLLSLGASGFKTLLKERKSMFQYLHEEVMKVAEKHGEKILSTPHNPISIAVSLSRHQMNSCQLTEIGSMLFTRNVSGLRVITGKEEKAINGHVFQGFGAHCSSYPVSYFTVAAAVGILPSHVDIFCQRLDKVLSKVYSNLGTKSGQPIRPVNPASH